MAGGAIAYSAIAPLFRSVVSGEVAAQVEVSQYDWEKHYWAFVVDTKKCIGCGRCANVCKLENNVPLRPECNRTWIERYVFTEDEEVFVDSPDGGIAGFTTANANIKYENLKIRKSFFIPKLCNQCDKAPCVRVCPVGATYMAKDGVILIDRNRCIGCRYCIQVCPYGARYFLREQGVADKCTWCYHRITKGLPPACVEACPVGARIFGNLKDPESKIVQILRKERVSVLKASLGTEPKVYYIGLENGVR